MTIRTLPFCLFIFAPLVSQAQESPGKLRLAHLLSHHATWHALEDFATDESAPIPYYIEEPREALAIDAAVLANREGFASATATYTDKASGTYDLTLITIVETDGESDYRVLKNGEEIGRFTNPEVTVDFEEAYFTIKAVTLNQNDVITVESNAVTNGKLPEGDDTGYSRGRWTGLVLH